MAVTYTPAEIASGSSLYDTAPCGYLREASDGSWVVRLRLEASPRATASAIASAPSGTRGRGEVNPGEHVVEIPATAFTSWASYSAADFAALVAECSAAREAADHARERPAAE